VVDTAILLYRLLATFLLVTTAAAAHAAAAPSRVSVADSPAQKRRPVLGQPFDLLPAAGGRFVVTDLPANAVYELDPAHGTGRLLARVREARELERLGDGRILVTSRARVLALNPRTGKSSLYATARNYLLGIALAPDGWLYASENIPGTEQTTLVRIRRGTREVLADFRGVHGILWTRTGLILSEAYAGRVLRFDPTTRAVEVLATGLGNPSFTLPAAGGGYFVSEFYGNRISHLWPDGHVTRVADVVQPGPIAFDARHRLVGVTLVPATLFRLVSGRARTIYS
jgi:streptogramin lyase